LLDVRKFLVPKDLRLSKQSLILDSPLMLPSDEGACIMIKQITSSEPLIGFVPQAIAADENPRLAGFPANVLYAGKRDESGLPYAIYFPDPATFAEEELCRQMIYRPEVSSDFSVRDAVQFARAFPVDAATVSL
jgi:hypothetical protein